MEDRQRPRCVGPRFPRRVSEYRGYWGPKAASDMLARDAAMVEVIIGTGLERVPLFRGGTPVSCENRTTLIPVTYDAERNHNGG